MKVGGTPPIISHHTSLYVPLRLIVRPLTSHHVPSYNPLCFITSHRTSLYVPLRPVIRPIESITSYRMSYHIPSWNGNKWLYHDGRYPMCYSADDGPNLREPLFSSSSQAASPAGSYKVGFIICCFLSST